MSSSFSLDQNRNQSEDYTQFLPYHSPHGWKMNYGSPWGVISFLTNLVSSTEICIGFHLNSSHPTNYTIVQFLTSCIFFNGFSSEKVWFVPQTAFKTSLQTSPTLGLVGSFPTVLCFFHRREELHFPEDFTVLFPFSV